VFNIEEESVPGACAETITADGDVGKSSLVNVVTDFLNAGEAALSNADNSLNELVTSGSLLSFLGEVQEHELDEFYHSNDKSTHRNTTSVVDVSKLDGVTELSLTLIFIGFRAIEVVSACCGHDHKLGGIVPPGHDPENSEEHSEGGPLVPWFCVPVDVSVLWNNTFGGSNRVQAYNACESIQPNNEGNNCNGEVNHWYDDHSLVLNCEVSGGIDNIYGFFDVFESTSNADAEAASKAGESDASD